MEFGFILVKGSIYFNSAVVCYFKKAGVERTGYIAISTNEKQDSISAIPLLEVYGRLRCFIAIEMPETVKSVLSEIEEGLKKSKADVKWVKPDNIHLTLKFLGNIKEENTEKIIKIMGKTCSHYNPFNLEIKGVGMFPYIKSPRVLWVGIESNDVLKTLQEEIDNGMASIGFEREDKKFTPHLTLGRFRSSTGKEGLMEIIKLHEKDSFGIINVKSISLIRSDLNPEGARYSKIAEVSLEKMGKNKILIPKHEILNKLQ